MHKVGKGFSTVEILIALVVAGCIAGVGWYVFASRTGFGSSDSGPVVRVADVRKETADWKSLSRFGITFKYPNNWDLQDANGNSNQETAVYLSSPGLNVQTADAPKGEIVRIDGLSLNRDNLTVDNFKEKFFGTENNRYRDYKVLQIHGKKAVQFSMEDTQYTVFFVKNNKTVTCMIDTFPKGVPVSKTASNIVASVEID